MRATSHVRCRCSLVSKGDIYMIHKKYHTSPAAAGLGGAYPRSPTFSPAWIARPPPALASCLFMQRLYTPSVPRGSVPAAISCVCLWLQADAGAQAVQIFDSWAANLSPMDFDVFAGPYLHYIIQEAKKVGGRYNAVLTAVQTQAAVQAA